MGFLQLLASLWPFLKEMFVGERLKARRKEDGVDSTEQDPIKDRSARNNILGWCVTKMQESKRFLAVILVTLILSLFVNHKVITKLSIMVLPPRNNEEKMKNETPPLKEPKEVSTIPNNRTSDRDELFDQTVRELKNLYGETR